MKPYSRCIDIASHCAALANLGDTWPACWQGLLDGRRPFVRGQDVIAGWPPGPPLSAVADFSRFGPVPSYADRFSALARWIARDMRPAVDALFERAPEAQLNVMLATSAGDPGALSTLVDAAHDPQGERPAHSVLAGILGSTWADPISEELGRDVQVAALFGACASSLIAMAQACDRIELGLSDAVLIIAVDTLSRVAAVGFHAIGAAGAGGSRPFDSLRDGTTVGEGAAGMLLVRAGLLPTGAVAGRVAGAGALCDATHLVEPSSTGMSDVVRQALTQASVRASDIACVYWHGTGTVSNDKAEAEVAAQVFGAHSPPCTSTKGSLGHTMGASGAFSALAACNTFSTGLVPPTAGTTTPAFANLDLVMGAPRAVVPGPILVTGLGFGGIDAAVVLVPPQSPTGAEGLQ